MLDDVELRLEFGARVAGSSVSSCPKLSLVNSHSIERDETVYKSPLKSHTDVKSYAVRPSSRRRSSDRPPWSGSTASRESVQTSPIASLRATEYPE